MYYISNAVVLSSEVADIVNDRKTLEVTLALEQISFLLYTAHMKLSTDNTMKHRLLIIGFVQYMIFLETGRARLGFIKQIYR